MPAGLAALALAVIPVNSPAQPVAATAATNPLLQEWTRPLRRRTAVGQGVARALQAGVPGRDRPPAQGDRGDHEHHGAGHVRQHDRGPAARGPPARTAGRAVRRHDQQPQHAGVPGARPRVVAEVRRRGRRDHVQREAVRPHRGGHATRGERRAHAGAAAARERTYDGFVRRARSWVPRRSSSSRRSTRSSPARSPTSPTRSSPTRTPGSCSTAEADLAGLPPSLVSAYKAAADERKLAGKWAVVNTRSTVDPFLTFCVAPRPAREGVEGVQEPRRQRQRQRHQRDHRQDRQAARRARHAARLRRRTRTGAWTTPWPATRRRPRS